MKVRDLIDKLERLPADDDVRLEWHDQIEAIYWSMTLPSGNEAWIISPHHDDKEIEARGRYAHPETELGP